jgi:hypothetical protein
MWDREPVGAAGRVRSDQDRGAAAVGVGNLSQHGLVYLGEDPPCGRVGGHRTEQTGLVAQHRKVSDRLTAVGEPNPNQYCPQAQQR